MEYNVRNTVIHLIGFPGAGKYTVAKEIVAQAPVLRLVDNHLINNPLFSLVRADGKTPLPPRIWDNVTLIWDAVIDTMVHLCPPETGFVLTNVLVENDADDRRHMLRMAEVARLRGGHYVPVRLLISDLEEHQRRIAAPERNQRLKETDPGKPRYYAENKEVLRTGLGSELTLDAAALPAAEAAKRILAHAAEIRLKSV